MTDNGIVSIPALHLNDMVSEFCFNDRRDLAIFQTESGIQENRIPLFFQAVDLVFSSLVLTSGIIRIQRSQRFKLFSAAFNLLLVIIQFFNSKHLYITACFWVHYNLSDL